MGFSNEFTWSKSRAATFHDCKRKYLFQYYAYWKGWQDSAPDRARRLYKLRSLVTVPMWAGSVLHDVMAHVLSMMRAGSAPPPLADAMDMARARIQRQWAYSSARKYWAESKPKNDNWFGLVEHELGVSLPAYTPDLVWLQVCQSLANIWQSDLWREVVESDRSRWLVIDERSFFYLDGVKLWAVPDLMYTRADGKTRIIDWKTGRHDGDGTPNDTDRMQLAGYVAYAHLEHSIALDDIIATLAYCKGERLTTTDIDADRDLLREFAVYARTSMDAMTEFLRAGDDTAATRRLNVVRSEDAFTKLAADSRQCDRCSFKNECWPTEATRAVA